MAAWRGLKLFAAKDLAANAVTRSEYEEEGQRVCYKFVM